MLNQRLYPIDRICLGSIACLSAAIAGLVWSAKVCGPHCGFENSPRVENFSWQDQQVGVEDKAFILTFDRPMDRSSVEKNLTIDPPLAGKMSWAGRRMAYTLDTPVPYGESYQVQLADAREGFREGNQAGQVMEPFVGEFRSRDRAFAYIGTRGEERGRLILYNLTQQRRTILTPPELDVMDFKFYPKGERVLFSAADRREGIEVMQRLQLYAVSIGKAGAGGREESPEKVELILDSQDYENNQFDLSPDGETIVVQRVNRKNPADFDLWAIGPGGKPQPLKVQGGEFAIAPDGQTLAVARGEGIGILPLQPDAKPLDFLPKFGQLLSFSPDGSAAAVVDFNTDEAQLRYTRSLFYVNNQGVQKELLTLQGSVLDCQFGPAGQSLYCLLTQLLPGTEYREQPYFARIDLKTAAATPLATLPEYRDIRVSLAPDGLALLFDQVVATDAPPVLSSQTTQSGEAIADSRLWLLIPPPAGSSNREPEIDELPLAGLRPRWLP